MRVFFFLFAFTSLLNVKSQVDFGSYKPIECEGEIPDDFVQAFKLGAIENIKKFETSVFTGEYLTDVNEKYFKDLEDKRQST